MQRAAPRASAGAMMIVAVALAAGGCYTGSARDISPDKLASEPGWVLAGEVHLIRQRSEMDCGAAAAAMVLSYWSIPTTVDDVTAVYPIVGKHGIKAGDLRDLVRARGLQAFLISGQLTDLDTELARGHPVLVGLVKPYSQDRALAHYEVVVAINRKKRAVVTLDPAAGWRENSFEGFAREWLSAKQVTLVAFPKVN